MRDKTREAMRLFLGGRCYTAEKLEKDYLAGAPQKTENKAR
ncbi:YadA [Escherichia coli]|nr:YadA [Escherichia coli]